MHEYVHFVQHNLGTNGISLIDYVLYNPTHYSNSDHIASIGNGGKGNKTYGAELAWTEGLATAFAMVTIDHFKTGYYSSEQALGAGGAGVQKTTGDIMTYNSYSF